MWAELGRWSRAGGSVGGAEMAVYDVNGDGLSDVVTSLEAHGGESPGSNKSVTKTARSLLSNT